MTHADIRRSDFRYHIQMHGTCPVSYTHLDVYKRQVSLTGNTGPYVQYAAARVRSIFRSAGVQIGVGEGDEARRIVIGDPAERALALALLEFGSVVRGVGSELSLIHI